jgi:hypothetical protein
MLTRKWFPIRDGYVKPTIPFVPDNQKLYRLETQAQEAIKGSARELAKVLGHKPGDFWTTTMPEALAAMLDSFEPSASRSAAIAYLESFGYVVNEPSADCL